MAFNLASTQFSVSISLPSVEIASGEQFTQNRYQNEHDSTFKQKASWIAGLLWQQTMLVPLKNPQTRSPQQPED